MTNPTPKPQPDGHPSLVDIDKRLSNVEQILLSLHAQMIPKWARYTSWGMFAGACIKVLLSGHS
jgi:hypothetical protein